LSFYSRTEIVKLLEIDEGFLTALETEEIIEADAPPDAAGAYSERMLERVRVAHELASELDVNLPGVAIIVRMREQMLDLRSDFERRLRDLRARLGDDPT
jgi:MerR family transcriptional regulator/heat shock protein HspR